MFALIIFLILLFVRDKINFQHTPNLSSNLTQYILNNFVHKTQKTTFEKKSIHFPIGIIDNNNYSKHILTL